MKKQVTKNKDSIVTIINPEDGIVDVYINITIISNKVNIATYKSYGEWHCLIRKNFQSFSSKGKTYIQAVSKCYEKMNTK